MSALASSDSWIAHSTMPCVPPAPVRLAAVPRRPRDVPSLLAIAQVNVCTRNGQLLFILSQRAQRKFWLRGPSIGFLAKSLNSLEPDLLEWFKS